MIGKQLSKVNNVKVAKIGSFIAKASTFAMNSDTTVLLIMGSTFVLIFMCAIILKCIEDPVWCNSDYAEVSEEESDKDAEYELTGEVITITVDLENLCAICLEEFNKGEQSRVLDCGHYYHQQCVDEWLQKKGWCPKCGVTDG